MRPGARAAATAALLAAALAACQKEPKKDVAGGDTIAAIEPSAEYEMDTTGLTEAADVAVADEPASTTAVLGDTPGRRPPTPPPPATPPVAAPAPAAPATTAPAPAAPATTPASGACATPGTASQRRCLMGFLARSDVALNGTYQRLIGELKRRAGTPAGAPEPDEVRRLRESQRAWLVYRDTECRRRNRGREGPLWAPVRAACLGEFSGARETELAEALRRAQGAR